jgi:membrane-associated protease RseP (regulator of RpoE activity)
MKQRIQTAAVVGGILLGLTAFAGPAVAESPQEPKIEKRRVIRLGEGEPLVLEGENLRFRRGFLGVGLVDLTPELRAHFGAPEGAGVLVSRVEPGSPAEKAGLAVGDVITSIDGKEVKSSWDLQGRVRRTEGNNVLPLEVWRGGKVQTLTATIEERERSAVDLGHIERLRGLGGMDRLLAGHLHGPDAAERIRVLGRIHSDEPGDVLIHRLRSPREEELQNRLKELEKRIADLEKQLERKNR